MNCLSSLRRFQRMQSWQHVLFLCVGTVFSAVVYLTYAWTILGPTGLLRWLHSISSTLRGAAMNGCSNSLEGPCLVDASVARFVQDHVHYAQDLVDIFFDCGHPLTAHLDPFKVQNEGRHIQVLEGLYAESQMVQSDEDHVPEPGPAIRELSDGLQEILGQQLAMGDILATAFTWELSSLPVRILVSLSKLREAELKDVFIAGTTAPYLTRVRAAHQKEELLMSIAPMLIQDGTETFVLGLTPVSERYTSSIGSTLHIGRESLRLLEDDIPRVRKLIASIPRFRFWWIYQFIFGDTSNTWMLTDLMESLISTEKHVRHVVLRLEDLHENFLLMVRYLHWYRDNSGDLLATYRPEGLKSFGEEINDAAQNYEQLYDDCMELRYLTREHPHDLVAFPVLNRHKNQMSIGP